MFCYIYFCISVDMYVPQCTCGAERKLTGVILPAPCRLPEFKLKTSGLALKCLYLLSHAIGP